ncbi:Na+:solute symporter [bacterium]|nr:Na+:solute symporter [bacterium]
MDTAHVFSFNSQLHAVDWIIITGYILFSIALGLYFSRRGTKSISDYFASGHGVPWWILGTSMVATTFAADTPLAISGLIVKQGVWGNWFWWAQIPMFIAGVFFFSRLWRRAQILTDTEFVVLRYSGRPSKMLRGFRAVYFALPYNCLVMGWVILSMTKILGLTFDIDKNTAIFICLGITMLYSSASGLWGVMVTDFFQFILAIGMAIYLAVISVSRAGGLTTILAKMDTVYGVEKAAAMKSIVPPMGDGNSFVIFLIYIFLLWWTVGNTDGGAYLAQRMIAAKNEKHSFLGYLWFNVAHFCLRPWPWILVGLVAAVQFPGIINPHTHKPDPEIGYIAVMLTNLKPGMLGLMLVSFLAAFMSTISTQINWGASYLINDLYRPFIKKNASEKHYVMVSIGATVFLCVLAGVIAQFMNDIFTGWLLFSSINAGIGIVYIVRWYWWRVNAWSEMSAIVSIVAVVGIIVLTDGVTVGGGFENLGQLLLLIMLVVPLAFLVFRGFAKKEWREKHLGGGLCILGLGLLSIYWVLSYSLPENVFPWTLLYTVPISMVVWLTVTLLTPPVDDKTLEKFYYRVHPGGPGWKQVKERLNLAAPGTELFTKQNFVRAFLAIVAVFSALFGAYNLFIGSALFAAGFFVLMIITAIAVVRNLSDEKWEEA